VRKAPLRGVPFDVITGRGGHTALQPIQSQGKKPEAEDRWGGGELRSSTIQKIKT